MQSLLLAGALLAFTTPIVGANPSAGLASNRDHFDTYKVACTSLANFLFAVPVYHGQYLNTSIIQTIEMSEHLQTSDDEIPFFDGGDTGCGELLLDLLLFMKQQPVESIVKVRALDPGAPLEIPAWCRLTKNELIESGHPFYKIKKKNSQGNRNE